MRRRRRPVRSRFPLSLVSRPNGELVVVTGASRSGKTTWVVHQVRAARRVLVWDGAGDWRGHGCEPIRSALELRERVRRPPRLERLAFIPPTITPAHFDIFCRLAWIWIRAARGVLIVEELADVTHPGKAPVAWGEIVRKGLRYGSSIYAISQRPSESDKTALGNASRVHCHRMQRAADCAYIAAELRVPVEEVDRLRPFEWIERDAWGRVTRGSGLRRRAPAA